VTGNFDITTIYKDTFALHMIRKKKLRKKMILKKQRHITRMENSNLTDG